MSYASIKARSGDFDNNQAYQRLLLSELKFARTKNKYLNKGWDENALYQCFEDLCYVVAPSEENPPRLLNEVGEVLEYHRQNPYSHPDEKIQNLGNISWGACWDSRRGYVMHDNSFSLSPLASARWTTQLCHDTAATTKISCSCPRAKPPIDSLNLATPL